MIAANILFLLSLFALIGAINALRAANTHRHPIFRPWWFPALLTAEAVPLRVAIHAAITTVLTETSNPKHMHENAMAAFGRMPDEGERRRMAALIDAV